MSFFVTPVVDRSPDFTYALANRAWQGVPSIEYIRNDRLWATWYSGGKREPDADNYVVLVTSDDGGKSWSEPVAVVSPEKEIRAFDPVLWRDPNGRLWWFWAQSLGGTDGRYGVWAVHTDQPESPNPCWSTPSRICNGIMLNKPTVLSDGRWALPTAIWNVDPHVAEFASERFSNMTVTDDHGLTFKRVGSADIPDRGYDEHHILERRDGRLWMLVRTHYGVGESFSSDGGQTWSPGAPSKIPGIDSRFFIRRLKSGRLLLISHPSKPRPYLSKERSHLTAWLSDDDGDNWFGALLIDERCKVSYPDAVETDDGRIFIIYDHNRYTDKQIMFAIVTEQDISQGRCDSASGLLKGLVSSP